MLTTDLADTEEKNQYLSRIKMNKISKTAYSKYTHNR